MTTNAIKRNPLSRLREILTKAQRGDRATTARVVWCGVFDIESPDTEEAFFEVQSRLISLRRLFADANAALTAIPDLDKELFLDPVMRLANLVDCNRLHVNWSTFIDPMTKNDFFALKYAEDLMRRNLETQENEVPSDELQQILTELNTLYESIIASSLGSELKTALLELIQEMLRGVHEYRVRGAVALRDSLAKSIGIVAVNKEAIDASKDIPEVQALARMLVRIDNAYTFAMKVQPLLQAAANILPVLAAHVK